MATGCAFSTGFDSGFAICVADERPTLRGVPAPPRQRFRRLLPVELEGVGAVYVLGRGELAIGKALAGEARVIVQGEERFARSLEFGRFIVQASALLGLECPCAGDGLSGVATATGVLGHEASVGGEATVSLMATGTVAAGVGLGGTVALPSAGVAVLGVITYVPALIELEGEALVVAVVAFGELRCGVGYAGVGPQAVTASGVLSVGQALEGWVDLDWSAVGDVEADDEQTTLAVLGLPSEVAW